MLVWIAQTCIRIMELERINRVAAMHVYETAMDAWLAYCKETHVEDATIQAWCNALDLVRPRGIA